VKRLLLSTGLVRRGWYLQLWNRVVSLIVALLILAVSIKDMLFVGPNDLASSLGYRAADHETNPVIQEAIERVQAAADKHGKYSGMFCTVPEQVGWIFP